MGQPGKASLLEIFCLWLSPLRVSLFLSRPRVERKGDAAKKLQVRGKLARNRGKWGRWRKISDISSYAIPFRVEKLTGKDKGRSFPYLVVNKAAFLSSSVTY